MYDSAESAKMKKNISAYRSENLLLPKGITILNPPNKLWTEI